MKKYIFTFARNHPLANFCQPIFAPTSEIARSRMFEKYGEKWAFQYSEMQWKNWIEKAELMGVAVEKELAPVYAREGEENCLKY